MYRKKLWRDNCDTERECGNFSRGIHVRAAREKYGGWGMAC